MAENSGQVTGIISDAAFNFIVQEPSGIIERSSPTSLRSSRFRYRIIFVSERCAAKTGCVMNDDLRASPFGRARGGSAFVMRGAGFPAASASTADIASTSPSVVVSSIAMPMCALSKYRKFSPARSAIAFTATVVSPMPSGTWMRSVSKYVSFCWVYPSALAAVSSVEAKACVCRAMAVSPSGP